MKFNPEILRVKNEEFVNLSEIKMEDAASFVDSLSHGLSVVWNINKKASLEIDYQTFELEKNCMIFLTEFHKVKNFDFESLRVIQFNRLFYCIEDNDHEVGCKGLLFLRSSTHSQNNYS